MAKWTSWNTYDLLMNILPRTDNSKYMKFCCLLRAKSILPSDGKRLCDKCKPLQKCRKNETVKFFIDPACHSLLKDGTAHDVDSDVPVDMNYVSDPENEEELVVFTSSVVCINNEIFATLTINIKEKYISKELLEEDIAFKLAVNVLEVQLTVSKRNSTWMLLRLSARAGLLLLQTLRTEKSRDELSQVIAEAFSSKSIRNVSVEVKISNMPSYTIFVVSTGTFPVKSDEDNAHLIVDGNQRMWTFGAVCLAFLLGAPIIVYLISSPHASAHLVVRSKPDVAVVSSSRLPDYECKTGTAMEMLVMNQRTLSSLSTIASKSKCIKKQVDHTFRIVDDLSDNPDKLENHLQDVTFRKEFLVENNNQNTLTLDALMNNRIVPALQDDCSIAGCFTRMKARETTVTKEVYDKLDVISGCQEDIELKLSQRPQVEQVAASISKLIETLETRVANVKLLRKKAKTDPKTDPMATEDDTVETRWLKLDKANKNDRVDMIRKIVKQGTEEKDKLGRTILHYAAHHGNHDVVDLLLDNKADPAALDNDGKKPFELAVKNGHLSTAGLLVLASEKVEDLTFKTRPLVFHWACKNKRVDVARNIVEHHGIEWKGKDGRNALDIVAVYDNVDIADIILKRILPHDSAMQTIVSMSMEAVAVEVCVCQLCVERNMEV
ncbi:uncharacterized protein LOC134177811 [Corticium candelabrum]|uniref:uncharacterized protein LOC134177811 n=1 Tax=Corticium candelabrum TaxID=121492 RepID=UPI002E25C8AC|nr:uncharacterized protein LOC134177811 [Corticium candelabrum]